MAVVSFEVNAMCRNLFTFRECEDDLTLLSFEPAPLGNLKYLNSATALFCFKHWILPAAAAAATLYTLKIEEATIRHDFQGDGFVCAIAA